MRDDPREMMWDRFADIVSSCENMINLYWTYEASPDFLNFEFDEAFEQCEKDINDNLADYHTARESYELDKSLAPDPEN